MKDKKVVGCSRESASWNTVLETMTSIVIIPQVDAVMYVLLSKAEKCALWGISWYH